MKFSDTKQLYDEDFTDLHDFLDYINLNWAPKHIKNNTLFKNNFNIEKSNKFKIKNNSVLIGENSWVTFEKSFYERLPVALVQLLILILVFLIFFFMCKCNKIMETCRDKAENEKSIDSDQLNDSIKLKDYFCYLWYHFKLKYCVRRRRRRRFRNRNRCGVNNKISNNIHVHRHKIHSVYSNDEQKRNDSLIFKRRSVIYRNSRSNRKTREGHNINNQNHTNLENIIEDSKENKIIVDVNKFVDYPSIQIINEIKTISKSFVDQFEESTVL